MGLVATKPVFWVFDKVRFKPACTATGTSYKIEILLVSSLIWYFPKIKTKGADQTVRMRRLVWAFVVRKLLKTGFLTSRPIYEDILCCLDLACNCPLIHTQSGWSKYLQMI